MMFLDDLLDELYEELSTKRTGILQEICDLETIPQSSPIGDRLRLYRDRLDNVEKRLVEIEELQMRIKERLPSAGANEFGDFRSLVDHLDKAEVRKEGRKHELIKAATKSIKEKLSTELHPFGNDKDFPFLIPEAQLALRADEVL